MLYCENVSGFHWNIGLRPCVVLHCYFIALNCTLIPLPPVQMSLCQWATHCECDSHLLIPSHDWQPGLSLTPEQGYRRKGGRDGGKEEGVLRKGKCRIGRRRGGREWRRGKEDERKENRKNSATEDRSVVILVPNHMEGSTRVRPHFLYQ